MLPAPAAGLCAACAAACHASSALARMHATLAPSRLGASRATVRATHAIHPNLLPQGFRAQDTEVDDIVRAAQDLGACSVAPDPSLSAEENVELLLRALRLAQLGLEVQVGDNDGLLQEANALREELKVCACCGSQPSLDATARPPPGALPAAAAGGGHHWGMRSSTCRRHRLTMRAAATIPYAVRHLHPRFNITHPVTVDGGGQPCAGAGSGRAAPTAGRS